VYHARPGFTQAVAALQANRVHVVPYTNERVFDPSSPVSKRKWEADGASRYTCNHYRGGPLTEKYEEAANFSFAVMDPASPGKAPWQMWPETLCSNTTSLGFMYTSMRRRRRTPGCVGMAITAAVALCLLAVQPGRTATVPFYRRRSKLSAQTALSSQSRTGKPVSLIVNAPPIFDFFSGIF
jgi:hypothetical protein